MNNHKTWFVIINPTSGNGLSKQKWPEIKSSLKAYHFNFCSHFTEYSNHSFKLVQQAIIDGYINIICVGGDGTLHNIVNGIMSQSKTPSISINVGVIPIGTGNDWVKTHNIPNDFEKAIQIIKNGQTKLQDVGKITLINSNVRPIYFINLAGIGFDGYVVSKVSRYKHFGAISYLIGTLMGLFSFKNFTSKTTINSEDFTSKTLMVLIGLCQYSGGGMQLTKQVNPFDGLFDVSIAKNFSVFDIIKNVAKLFNGKIVDFKKVDSYKTTCLKIDVKENDLPFIQADGELIGQYKTFNAKVIPKAFSFFSDSRLHENDNFK